MAPDEADMSLGNRLGRVISVDHAAHTAVVQIADEEEEGTESHAIPFASARMGKMRVWMPPSIGEQVEIICPEGDIAGAYIGGALACDAFPHIGDSETVRIDFDDGTSLTYDPVAHALEAVIGASGTVRVEAEGGITLVGDVTVEGTLTASIDVVGGGKSLKNHVHSGVQAGGAQSGPPA